MDDIRKDYVRRLIAGVRKQIDADPDTMKAKEECGEGVIIGRWMDAELLCSVIETTILNCEDKMLIDNPLGWKKAKLQTVLRLLAAQENCDGHPYDQMMIAAARIDALEIALQALLDVHKPDPESSDVVQKAEQLLAT